MSLYKTGTVALTNNSNAVTGTGTSWLTEVAVGDSFKRTGENAIYSIASIPSNTSLTLTVVYAGVTGSGLSYSIGRDFTPIEGIPETDASDPDMPYRMTTALRKIDEIHGLKAPLASPVFTTQITTPKIVTASGALEITPAGNANIILQGSGTGKVGIGVTPAEPLDVVGLIKTQGVTGGVVLYPRDGSGTEQLVYNPTGDDLRFYVGGSDKIIVQNSGNVGIGPITPTAVLHLKAGTSAANTAPLKLTAGTNLTTPENGAIEFDGTNLYVTIGGVRKTIQVA